MDDHVIIFDTTLRDGEQAPGFNMNLEEKLRLAEQLEHLNVDVIEAGFPIASDGDFLSVREIARNARKATVAGLCRTKEQDINRAWEALQFARRPRIHTFIATSNIHLKYKLRKSKAEALKDAVWAVEHAKGFCDDVEFSAEDATRSDLEYLFDIFSAVIAAGATVINVPDTVGYCLPWEFGDLIQKLIENVDGIGGVLVSVHCHDDLGHSVSNSISAITNGARQIECTINGIGERAGNAALEEIVMTLRTRRQAFSCDTRVDATQIYAASQLLSEITGVQVQPNKSIVGDNAFAHEAGIHQDGVLKNALTYEIMTPESVGVSGSRLVLGKHSGRNALHDHLRKLGHDLDRATLSRVYQAFIALADAKKNVDDHDLRAIVAKMTAEAPQPSEKEFQGHV